MAGEPSTKPSFSPYRRWGIGLQVLLVLCVVFCVVVMVNYVSQDKYVRWHVSSKTRIPLAPRTVKLLESLTNEVKVTVYYDKDEPFYSTVLDLLNEYRARSPKLSLQIVDYKRDPGAAQQLKAKYPFLAAPAAKNLVIFDCEGRGVKPVDGNALTKYVLEQLVPNEKEQEFRRRPTTFEGERAFTAALLQVTSPKPLKAYFVKGHGEHEVESSDKDLGYLKFASVLGENYVQVDSLSLSGTNPIPADCNLLIIAGPTTAFAEQELDKVEQYLNQGGRLFALFNFLALRNGDTGLEKLLGKWGVDVTSNIVVDKDNSITGSDVIVQKFSANHPVVNPLLEMQLHLILPRSVGKVRARTPPVDAPQAEEIAFSGPNSVVQSGDPKTKRAFPLITAVEKGAIKGVVTERGTTRLIVAGDSIFLGNKQIDSAANRDFAAFASNWLLDRPQLLEDLGPRPVTEYRLIMTRTQLQAAEWLLLGGMPGVALLLGCLIWVRRRR